MKRTLFIGDVHGCLTELKELLEKVNYNKKSDRLIYLGDILNKGPSSVETLMFIKNQKVECLLGNNEVGFLDAARNGGYYGSSLRNVVEDLGDSLEEYCQWIESFPTYIEEEDFIAVHAGVAPNSTIKETSVKIRTCIRTWDGVGKNLNKPNVDPDWYDLYKGDKTIIYGHYAARGLQVNEKTIGLDSGCVFGGELTCLEWPSRKLYQVKAKKQYLDIVVKK